ncbi:nitrite reductase large subunit NirB [Domibacillus enclensis]|uniref:Assimilatory nitrite reductase (NAD(P)H) large subunit n=1 Tax=Domibacillus enclensis TaxID=1017273 RepID=A0A1N6NW04_9BACI|nr:nitrite reductase large subunit NirB [Domibacillus enclensis]OXS80158.1 nitrite reductase large subunit [Domibacillus enclensis]SIP96142.1 assimilatory nitrite reductase (NAD(P)H) large subunit precursor [Domibacillus enclensis]
MKEKLVLIGNGMAGIRCLEEIIAIEPERFDITVFGDEPHVNYNRIMLSKVLQGNTQMDEIVLNRRSWYETNGIHLHTGDAVAAIDSTGKTVTSVSGKTVPYDHLIIATGSNPFILPLPGADQQGVIGFRNIQDCETMMTYAKKKKRAVVIGGGLLGLEAARGLLNLNMDVYVVHVLDSLMEAQLDAQASAMLKEELEAQGMTFLMNKQTIQLNGDGHVTGLTFKDGSELAADLVVMAVGIRPNIKLAQEIGLQTNRAIIVNDYMETSLPDIYAVGECAEHRGVAYGLVAPLYEQGKTLAKRLVSGSRSEVTPYTGSVVFTQLKVSGVDVFSAGDFHETEETKSIRVHDEFDRVYKKVVIEENRVRGAVLFGDTSDAPRLLDLMRKRTDISSLSKVEILPAENSTPGEHPVVTMAADEIVCGCNGVTKGRIVQAIVEENAVTLDGVKETTNACRSCGGCKPMIEALLEHTLGEDFQVKTADTLCNCTDLSHEQVATEIREKGLQTTKEVMNVLGWKNEEGCSKCRPALNYYLGMIHPLEHEDEPASRFVNERLHANINKDGTFSVVPRMYGGVTDVQQLRKIADVAEKYNVPLLKVTGGQRIDLFGVKKEDLPHVWKELDMPSGYAYGKTLRTVKTCVGERFCRFGTQDSVGFGIRMEKKLEGMSSPHKVKLGVSACPRNCAESLIKDVGLVGLEGGWDIYVGGNGGVDLRQGELLGRVGNDDEAEQLILAFLQLYRENARYLERTSAWIERVGLESVKEQVFARQPELAARLEITLSTFQEPWKAIVENDEVKNQLFQPGGVQ